MTAVDGFSAGQPLGQGPFVPADPMEVIFSGQFDGRAMDDGLVPEMTRVAQPAGDTEEQPIDPNNLQSSAPSENGLAVLGSASIEGSEPVSAAEGLVPKTRWQRTKDVLGKATMAAMCAFPAIEYAGSDVLAGKGAQIANRLIPQDQLALGAVAGVIVLQSFLVGLALRKSRKMAEAADTLGKYIEARDETASLPRKIGRTAIESPFIAMAALGKVSTKLGKKIPDHPKILKPVAKAFIDFGAVTAGGTTAPIVGEILNKNTPSATRIGKLCVLMGASWYGGTDLVETVYRKVPPVRPELAFIGRPLEAITNVNLIHPLEARWADLAVVLAALLMGRFGWKLSNFKQKQEELGEGQKTTALSAPTGQPA